MSISCGEELFGHIEETKATISDTKLWWLPPAKPLMNVSEAQMDHIFMNQTVHDGIVPGMHPHIALNCSHLEYFMRATKATLKCLSFTPDDAVSFLQVGPMEETSSTWNSSFSHMNCTWILDLSPTPECTLKRSQGFTCDGVTSFILVKTMEDAAAKWNFPSLVDYTRIFGLSRHQKAPNNFTKSASQVAMLEHDTVTLKGLAEDRYRVRVCKRTWVEQQERDIGKVCRSSASLDR